MIDFVKTLEANPNGVFATQDGEKVRTRIFQYLFADGKKVYFSTTSDKPVYSQLQANPQVSFCTFPQNFTPVLSLNGKAVFTEDSNQGSLALKARALDENPGLKELYKSPDNPIFKILYIDVEEVETFSPAEGPKTYKL
jgi:uncharacterized pyridoxamine 5'-phosphate oxidase family protein